eukprot:1160114-Pelagomonas_calceolata.AAC.5
MSLMPWMPATTGAELKWQGRAVGCWGCAGNGSGAEGVLNNHEVNALETSSELAGALNNHEV